MQNLRNKLVVGGAVLILAAIGSVMNRQPAQAAGAPVTIESPIPLPVTGSVAVTGNVGINGSPSVNVATLPAVQLSGTPTVNVVTASGAPLSVVNLSDRGRTPYQSTLQDCAGSSCIFPAVPSGHRLVVESISVLVTFPSAVTFYPNAALIGSSGIVLNLPLNLPLSPQNTTAGAAQSLFAFFDSGDQPKVIVIPQAAPTVTLSGYLVDCTFGPCAPIAH